MIDWHAFSMKAFKGKLDTTSIQPVAGGDICQSFQVRDDSGGKHFVKVHANPAVLYAEFYNLRELYKAPVHTPRATCCVQVGGVAALAMPYISLRDIGDEYQLGVALARTHQVVAQDGLYGFGQDNYIGDTLQLNTKSSCWLEFWWEQRLLPQLSVSQRALNIDADRLYASCQALLKNHNPLPSLLHGDLWGGNKAFLPSGEPVLFDPACYYGDREADVAFTYVFGGFGPRFYQGYMATWPLPDGHEQRRPLYNLYHLLNHYNLFGSGYASAVKQLMDQIGI